MYMVCTFIAKGALIKERNVNNGRKEAILKLETSTFQF